MKNSRFFFKNKYFVLLKNILRAYFKINKIVKETHPTNRKSSKDLKTKFKKLEQDLKLPLSLPNEVKYYLNEDSSAFGNCLENLEDTFKKLEGNTQTTSRIYSRFNFVEKETFADTELKV